MTDRDKEKQLDELLDSLLSHYASAEPRPGLETRVLAQIEQSRRDNDAGVTGWRWLVAGGALLASAAALVIVVMVFRAGQRTHSSPSLAQSGHTRQVPDTPKSVFKSPVAVSKRPVRNHKTIVAQAAAHGGVSAERPALFPTPVPLSQQERLMFTYMANTPRQEVVSQITTDDQKEAAAFWAQADPLPGTLRPALTR
jgi:hypothetical protein